MRFLYLVELKEGYFPTMETELETDVCITVEAKDRVTADRALATMLKGCQNVNRVYISRLKEG